MNPDWVIIALILIWITAFFLFCLHEESDQ